MENLSPKLNGQSKRNPPPKRGQIKLRIIKSLITSVASSVGAIGGTTERSDGENGESLSPINSPAPAATPSGYTSDARSDCS
ncbi:hypothetical protein L484_011191 [Morus notabilis]|uniref:Uncharacterized protein n=1 Tax=Morus notabilis TaxID=981085 RepID=W9SIG0_9ROSA|nr:hypothetical protein L484_011191 [Morus notabilis]